MAKDKDRAINPAQAQRKLDKQKAVKKGKAEIQARRNEKLGRRNPERLQRQIDELKSLEGSGQSLKPKDKKILEELERDVSAIKRARAALGDKAPSFGRERRQDTMGRPQGTNAGVLGKRRRDGQPPWEESDSTDTDESVKKIPMPRDTPPPVPSKHGRRRGPNANTQSTNTGSAGGETIPHALPPKPELQAKSVYESAPVVRNLRQEAVSKFVPTAVRRKQDAVKGQGRLMEPEEIDSLEREGYRGVQAGGNAEPTTREGVYDSEPNMVDAALDLTARDRSLAEEEARFERELKHVSVEDVEDEDG
jgi:hypothetical protein